MRTIVIRITLALAAIACSKPSNDVSTPASSGSTSSASTASAAAPPRLIDPGPTAADRVGVLAPNTGIPVGQHVPEVSGRDLEGRVVALSSLYANGPILLAFYRGGWCPYCNGEIHALTTAYPEYRKRGVTPVAVSVDTLESEAKLKATYAIPFPVLSDSDAVMLDAFHVAKQLTQDEVSKYKGHGVDLESFSGRAHHKIAIPALFLVDKSGTVRWAHSDPDFKIRPTTAQILAAIDATGLMAR